MFSPTPLHIGLCCRGGKKSAVKYLATFFSLLQMIKVLSRPNYVSRVFYVVLLTSFEDCQTIAAAAVVLMKPRTRLQT